jgi:hypothetical protein
MAANPGPMAQLGSSPKAAGLAHGIPSMRRSSGANLMSVAATMAIAGLACDGGVRSAAGKALSGSTDSGGSGAALNVPWMYIDAGCPPGDGSPKVAEPDAGDPIWMCVRTMCSAELEVCGGDCECNNLVLSGLICASEAGAVDACFGEHVFPALGTGRTMSGLFYCLSKSAIDCVANGGAVEDANFHLGDDYAFPDGFPE